MDARDGRGREVAVSETRWLFEADRSAAMVDAEGWKLDESARTAGAALRAEKLP